MTNVKSRPIIVKKTSDRARAFGIGAEEFRLFKAVEPLQVEGMIEAADFTVEYIRRRRGNGLHFRLWQFSSVLHGAFETANGAYVETARLDITRFLYIRGVRAAMVRLNNTCPDLLSPPGDEKPLRLLRSDSVLGYEDPELIRAAYRRAEEEGRGG